MATVLQSAGVPFTCSHCSIINSWQLQSQAYGSMLDGFLQPKDAEAEADELEAA